MWGRASSPAPTPEFSALNRSLDVDGRLWREDVRGSRAWIDALARAGALLPEEASTLLAGLDRVAARFPDALTNAPDEDIHSLVERLLYEEVGDLAGKLHTGRSRNDQVATDTRLWTISECGEITREMVRLQAALLRQAEAAGDVVMPGYTHLRRAEPIRAAHWLLAHFWRLERDRDRLRLAAERASVLPLGSGALAGTPVDVDREQLRTELGFRDVSPNSIDAVSDRDWVCEALFAFALLGVHLSGLAEDLILFSSAEFGFLHIDERVTSGSSRLPQKRNPDGLELARAGAASLIGDLTTVLALLKALPAGYNKDLQGDKEPLMHAADTLRRLLPVVTQTVDTLELDRERIAAALDPSLLAAALADRMAQDGTPFREAHQKASELVRDALRGGDARGPRSDQLRENGNPFLASCDRYSAAGGTGADAVAEQLRLARERLRE